jgi:hypothetical protein
MSTSVERPILFSGPMVRALLAGRKTQTRRLIGSNRWIGLDGCNLDFSGLQAGLYCTGVPSSGWVLRSRGAGGCWNDRTKRLFCPYGDPGGRLWVRETWGVVPHPPSDAEHICRVGPDGTGATWRAEWLGEPTNYKWRPSIHMPRWASRLNLEVTAVRAQRLQDISGDDARAEGFSAEPMPARVNGKLGQVAIFEPRRWFATLWDAINAKRAAWAENPWVWAISFRVVEGPRAAAPRLSKDPAGPAPAQPTVTGRR